MEAKILPAGETCLFVDFGEVIDLAVNGRVQALARELSERPFRGMKELVPTYRSLSVYFDPQSVDLPALRKRLEAELANPSAAKRRERREVRVPDCFCGQYGPNRGDVAAHTGRTEEDLAQRY